MKNSFFPLNDEQKRAVGHHEGPCLVLAGPGTGKTTIIVNRVLNLIKKYKVEPENILVVTFTKAAAEEMHKRFMLLEGYTNTYNQVTFGTFHSVFFKILKQYKNYKIEYLINENEKKSVIKSILNNMGLGFYGEGQALEDLLNELAYIENMLITERKFLPLSCGYSEFWAIYDQYKKYKVKANKFDFEDMVTHCYKLMIDNSQALHSLRMKYKYILIDEFQDINKSQLETIFLIADPLNNLFIVGDDDQSIYKFRGSDSKAMLRFPNQYKNTTVITLKTNYRSSKAILNSAMCVINNNSERYEKNLIACNGLGNNPYIVPVQDNEQEAQAVVLRIKELLKNGMDYSEMAVLFRTRIQSSAIIDNFILNRIPYTCSGGLSSVYNHWINNDIIGYLKASHNIDRNNNIYRIINKPYRKISKNIIANSMMYDKDMLDVMLMQNSIEMYEKKKLKKLKSSLDKIKTMNPGEGISYIRYYIGYEDYIRQWADKKNIKVKPLLEIMDEISASADRFGNIPEYLRHLNLVKKIEYEGLKEKSSVKIMTMHKAKGLEFKTVFIIGANDGLTPYYLTDDYDKGLLEEERRLFYVSMTRAKEQLYIYVPKYRYGKRAKPSRFLDEMVIYN